MTSLRDKLAAIDDKFEKTQATERVESVPLKIKLISGAPGKSNSSVIEVILLRTLIGYILEQATNSQFQEGTSQSES